MTSCASITRSTRSSTTKECDAAELAKEKAILPCTHSGCNSNSCNPMGPMARDVGGVPPWAQRRAGGGRGDLSSRECLGGGSVDRGRSEVVARMSSLVTKSHAGLLGRTSSRT